MKINGTDIRAYNAKQLTADVQPPSIMNNYEWLSGATLPTELETDVQMGHLKLSIYFKGKDRNSIIRSASEFMMNFTKPCRLELDGYKGTYIGFITSNDYEKKNVKQRYVVNVEFDGFFVDDDLSITFDGKPPHRSIKWVQETLRALWRYMQKHLDELHNHRTGRGHHC